MRKKVDVIFEMAKDGGCSCHLMQDFPDFALTGYGESPQEAKAELLQTYSEMKDIFAEQGKHLPDLEFVYHYDMKSFFEYFDFLNVSKVAQRAGINPSLMRKYTSGVTKAGEGQYLKLQAAVKSISEELAAANF